MVAKEPVAERPSSPADAPAMPWTDVIRRLENGDTYLLATVRPDARPHVVPIPVVASNRARRCFYPDGVDEPPSDVYKVTPAIALDFGKEAGFSATRWRF